MIAAMFIAAGMSPAQPSSDPPSFGSVLKTYTLAEVSEYFPIGWTLIYEMRFYLIVGLAVSIIRARNDVRFLVIGAAIGIGILLAATGIAPADPSTSPMMLEFLFGAATAAIALKANKYAMTCGIAAMIGLIAAIVSLNLGSELGRIRVYGFGIPAAFALYSAMALEASERLTFPTWLSRAGDASYSIYLWHLPVILVMLPVFSRAAAPRIVYYVATLAATLVVAMLSWNFIERPILQAAGKRPSRQRAITFDPQVRMAA